LQTNQVCLKCKRITWQAGVPVGCISNVQHELHFDTVSRSAGLTTLCSHHKMAINQQ